MKVNNLKTKGKLKPKPTAARTAHMCVHIIVHNCRTQYSTEQFWPSSQPITLPWELQQSMTKPIPTLVHIKWSIQQRKIKRRLPMLKRWLFPRCQIPPKSLHHRPSSHPSSTLSSSLPPHPQSDKHATSPGKWQIPSVTTASQWHVWNSYAELASVH